MDAHGRTGLMMAIDFEDHQVIEALLCANRRLVKIPFRSPNGFDVFTYPIHFSAQIAARRDVPETLTIPKLLNSRIDDPNSGLSFRDNMGKTPLHLAVTGPSSVVAFWILEEDIGLMQIEDVLGRTPLHYCASAANFDLLLKQGASVNHVDKSGMAALHRVCYLGATDLVACLLEWNPRMDLRDKTYGTPLHCGVISGSIDVVMALVEKGAPLNAADANGNTAVHVAAKIGRHNILRLLIQQGADISLQNTNGRDPEAIALDAADNVGILSILNHRRRESPESPLILDIVDEDTKASSLDNQVTSNDSPDFLWDEDSKGAAEQNELMSIRQSANDDLYTYEEQQEGYYQRKNKSKTLDHITSTVLRHSPSLRQSRRAVTALVKLLSVFFDDMIWQPSIASRMIELIARAAHEFACIVLFHFEEACRIQQRIKAWVDFLTKHDGILLENKKQLDWFWTHMEGNDPVSVPDQADQKLKYWPNKKRFGGGVFQKQIPLQSLLRYTEETFTLKPAYRSVRNVQDRKKFDLRNMVESWEEEIENVESSRDVERRREVKKQREVERKEAEKNDQLVRALEKQEAERIRRAKRKLEISERKKGKLRQEELGQDERKEQRQPQKPKLEDLRRQKAHEMSYSDHVNLAINLIATLVTDRKPQTVFPGRLKSDIENMARWEFEALKMCVPKYGSLNCLGTLFDFFPQLSGRSWREGSSRNDLKWKDEKAFLFFREEHEDERAARIEFFAKVHSSCTRRMENEQSDVDDVDTESDKASKPWLEKAKEKLKVFKSVC
ncbi:serine threonine-protein phosphatase 6 regulatory ankyrin repeat subunit b [Colletotrichum asianum]|uniref:Serine threonine-protein phosphatase 6 regulatory ankyrin repeat subunit b n=1 Tax=Colletotrichum asianum TaxID=702518 RepID=A0A8H3WF02_9PEZI|nr:serine threonine-protein phosphatase 6 regulatory ankyrin repeat subunit b [Colletotrichum asianum]